MGTKTKKNNIRSVLIIGIVLLSVAGFANGIDTFKNIYNTIHPYQNVEFETSKEEVVFDSGDGVRFKVPKAYLYIPYQMEGGEADFSVRASMEEGMPAWTLSEAYKNRDESKGVSISISTVLKGHDYKSLKDYVYTDLTHTKEYHEEYNGKKFKFDLGVYRNVFNSYAKHIDKKTGHISEMLLKPLDKDAKPVLVSCNLNGNPDYLLCNAFSAFYYNKRIISYRYQVPLRIVEKYLEYDEKVLPLVKSFIENNGK